MKANECKKLDNLFNDGLIFKCAGHETVMDKRITRGGEAVRTLMMKPTNCYLGVFVELTRMTAKSGTIVYAVIIRHVGKKRRNGKNVRGYKEVHTFTKIGEAWKVYKMATA